MSAMQGSCQCGRVRFEVAGPFTSVSYCHCTTCKKISGGVGTASGRTGSEDITLLEGPELIETYQPHEGSAKSFCRVCGSNLFGGGWPDSEQSSVRLSAIDSGLEQKPEKHIFVRSVAAWETLPDDGLPRDEVQSP
ncbi:MAG: GFA family protein [Gaiellaceae bacterium]